MSQKQPCTHITPSYSILEMVVFVAPNLLPHMTLLPYDTEFLIEKSAPFGILCFF